MNCCIIKKLELFKKMMLYINRLKFTRRAAPAGSGQKTKKSLDGLPPHSPWCGDACAFRL